MNNEQITRCYHTPVQGVLPLEFSYSFEKEVPKDDITRTIRYFVEHVLDWKDLTSLLAWNSSSYPRHYMLEAVLLAYALEGFVSLRKLEELCHFDMRFLFIFNGAKPSHMTFHRFINDAFEPLCFWMEQK